MSQFKAVLWDLDGTLVANTETFQKALLTLCQRFSFSVPQTVPSGACLITLWESLIHQESPQLTFKDFIDEIHEACITPLTPLSLRKNISEVVATLYEAQIKQSCVSNSMAHFINVALARTEIASYFEHCIGRDNVEVGKPSPGPYLMSSTAFQLKPNECLVVEDTPLGIEAAKKAGMTAIAFLNEHSATEVCRQADYILKDIREIYSLLNLSTPPSLAL